MVKRTRKNYRSNNPLFSKNLTSFGALSALFLIIAFTFTILLDLAPLSKEKGDLSEIRSCKKLEPARQEECYRGVLKSWLKRSSPSAILSELQAIEKEDSCHDVGHYLGQESYKRLKSTELALKEGGMVCSGGYYHGVMEGYFMESKPSSLGSIVNNLVYNTCRQAEDFESKTLYFECVHGIGHGLMYVTGHDALEALNYCDLTKGEHEARSCYTGVFMESVMFLTRGESSSFSVSGESFLACNQLPRRYKEECFKYLPIAFLLLSKEGFQGAMKLCEGTPQAYREECLRSLGSSIAFEGKDAVALKSSCEAINNLQSKNNCIQGVVFSLATRNLNDPSLALRFCELVDETNKTPCYGYLGKGLELSLGTSGKIKVCSQIRDTEGKQNCLYYQDRE